MAGRGRGIVVGRGRGKPKTQEVLPLSDEDKRRLIEGGGVSKIETTKVEPAIVPGQFADSKDDSNGETDLSIAKATYHTPEPNDNSKTQLVNVKETSSQNTPPKPSINDSHPSNGYYGASSGGRSMSSPATLNPNSNEFVPSSKLGKLNVMATEFIPISHLPPPFPLQDEAPPPNDDMLTTLDILEGFMRRSPIDDPILEDVADMLIMTTLYPGTYDERLQEFSETIKLTPPTDTVLQDIGEMLIQWGVTNSGLRYTAVRICDFMCKADLQSRFRTNFFTFLQEQFKEEQEKAERSEEEMSQLMEFSLFVAEMFYRVRIGDDEVVWVLGMAVMELMFILIDLKQDDTVKCACNILKLTGYLLENKTPAQPKFDPIKKMDTVVLALKHICNDKTFNKRVSEVIINVLSFRGRNYDREPKKQKTEPAEAPVTQAQDWGDFVDDSGNVIEGIDDEEYLDYYETGDDMDPNIDDEIMRGYEEFLQDFEDHLLLQEFGNPAHK